MSSLEYLNGRQAFKEGKSQNVNPYRAFSGNQRESYFEWKRGYDDARTEFVSRTLSKN